MKEAIRLLLAAAMELSPTGTEQAAFNAIANQERRPDDVIVMDLAAGILTGVSHGDWPKVDG